MKLKKTAIIGLMTLAIGAATSCTDWLDLRPESETVLEDFWQTESQVNSVLASCYRAMTETDYVYRLMVWGELRSDNMVADPVSVQENFRKILNGDLTATNAYCTWRPFYTVINYCNSLLHFAPSVVGKDQNFTLVDLHHVQAEALALRALNYFYLVRAFKQVPWIEEPSIDDKQNYTIPKESEANLIKHIIDDLESARQLARIDYPDAVSNKGRITVTTIDAILADVYLWDQQYTKCIAACDNVLANKNLKLVDSELAFTRIFYLGNSTESIFELQFDEKIQYNFPVLFSYGSKFISGGEGIVTFPATLGYSQEEGKLGVYSPFKYKVNTTIEGEEDIRAKDSYLLVGDQYRIFKYIGLGRTEIQGGKSSPIYRTGGTPNWIVYRLSDVMLMKAEALVQLDTVPNTNYKNIEFDLVNATYLRSNPTADSLNINNYPSQDDRSKLVLRERQRELLFEGKRWFDLVRLARREKSTNSVNEYVGHKAGASTVSLSVPVINALYFPISATELFANKNLEQNPYYQETTSSSTR